MSETLSNVDELEQLLADLSDTDLLDLVDEKPAPAPVAKPVVTAESEVDDIDLALLDELEAVEAKPVVEPQPEMVVAEPKRRGRKKAEAIVEPATPLAPEVTIVEPTDQAESVTLGDDAEIDALLSAAAESVTPEAPVATAASSAPEEGFKPESDLRTFLDADKLRADLEFTETNISNAMTRQAALFAHYSTLAHQAQFQADRADQQVDLVEAQLDQRYRDAFASAGTKVTENMIKASIIKDEKYQKALLRKHEAKAIAEMVKSAADSFRHRRDMLIQVGADLRQQAQGGVRVNEHPGHAAMEALSRRASA